LCQVLHPTTRLCIGQPACTLGVGHLTSFLVPSRRHYALLYLPQTLFRYYVTLNQLPFVTYCPPVAPHSPLRFPPLSTCTIALGFFTSPSLYAGTITDTDDMSSSRQNVTWVEVCSSNTSLPLMSLLTCKRVCGESPHSGSSSHTFAEHGTIVCGHLATTKMPHHNSSNCLSYGYHGRDGLVSPCLLSLLDTYVLSSLSDRPSPETSQLP
jgi:hypothetical protein